MVENIRNISKKRAYVNFAEMSFYKMENKFHAIFTLKNVNNARREHETVCKRQCRSTLIAFNRVVLYHQYYNQRGDG